MEKRKLHLLPKHFNTVESRKRHVRRQKSWNCIPQATESAKIKSNPNVSLLWALLFNLCFWLTALFFAYSQGTIMRKHSCIWSRGRESENWRQWWREKFKTKFLATGRAKNRGKYSFFLIYVEMNPVAVGMFPSMLQKTVISGIRQNDWWTAAMWSLVIAVNYNQWVTVLSTMIYKYSPCLELRSDEYLIPTSPLLGGAFLLLHLSELAFKVPH